MILFWSALPTSYSIICSSLTFLPMSYASSAIAIKVLDGIRMRTTVRKGNRYIHNSWSFHQIRSFIEYKAREAGIPVIAIDPHNTSRECPECHTIDRKTVLSDPFSCAFPVALRARRISSLPSTSGTGLPSASLLWRVLFLIISIPQLQANVLQPLVVD